MSRHWCKQARLKAFCLMRQSIQAQRLTCLRSTDPHIGHFFGSLDCVPFFSPGGKASSNVCILKALARTYCIVPNFLTISKLLQYAVQYVLTAPAAARSSLDVPSTPAAQVHLCQASASHAIWLQASPVQLLRLNASRLSVERQMSNGLNKSKTTCLSPLNFESSHVFFYCNIII